MLLGFILTKFLFCLHRYVSQQLEIQVLNCLEDLQNFDI